MEARTFRDQEKINPEFAGKFSETGHTLQSLESAPDFFDGHISEEPVLSLTKLEIDHTLNILENTELQGSIPLAPVEKGPRPEKIKRRPTWRQHLLALGATLGINTAGVLSVDKGLRDHLIEDGRTALAQTTETEADKQALATQAMELLQQKDKEKVVEERLELFLKVLHQRGGVSEEDISITRDFFHTIQNEFKKVVQKQEDNDEEKKSTLFELVKKFGRYDVHFARLSDVAEKQKFNCDVLAQSLLVTVPAIYPDMPVKLQWFGGDKVNVPHVRVVIKISGKWYAIEKNGPEELSLKDIKGTIITGPEAFEKSLVEKVGEAASGDRKVLSAESNSVFGISFANAKVFQGGSTKTETDEEYQARMRSNYVGGKPLDPQNLPPMTMYMGTSVEHVASAMDGVGRRQGQKNVDTLKPEDPHPLPEEVMIGAIMEGDVNLLLYAEEGVFYDLSSLDGIQIDSLSYSFQKNESINNKFIVEFKKRFSTIKEFYGDVGNAVHFDLSFLRDFSLLEGVTLFGVKDISFLEGKTHLSSVNLQFEGTIDLLPLQGIPLESLVLWCDFRNSAKLDIGHLKKLTVRVNGFHQKEAEVLMAEAPVLENLSWIGGPEMQPAPFSTISHFATTHLKDVFINFLKKAGKTEVDLRKFAGQPLEKFRCFSIVGDITQLPGDQLKMIDARLKDGISFADIARKFPHVETLHLDINTTVPRDFEALKKLGLKELWLSDYRGATQHFSLQNLKQMSGLDLNNFYLSQEDGALGVTPHEIAQFAMDPKKSTFTLKEGNSIHKYNLRNGVLTQVREQ